MFNNDKGIHMGGQEEEVDFPLSFGFSLSIIVIKL